MRKKTSSIIFTLIILTAIHGCGQTDKKNNQDMESVKSKIDTLLNCSASMRLYSFISWGDQNDQIEPTLSDAPAFGYVSKEQMRKTYAGILVKADEKGGVHIMKQYMNWDVTNERNIPIIHFSPDGKFIVKTELAQLKEPGLVTRCIFDYAVDSENNTYLLEELTFSNGKDLNRLVKINSKGEILWDVRGLHSDTELDYQKYTGAFTKLMLTGNSKLFLIPYPAEGKKSIGEMNTQSGEMVNSYSFNKGNTNRIFINDSGLIARSFSIVSENQLYFGLYDINLKTETDHIDSTQIWGDMIGFDNNKKSYTYMIQNGFKKISSEGTIEQELLIRDIVVREDDKSVYTNWLTNDSNIITRYKTSGEVIRYLIPMPTNMSGSSKNTYDNCRLIHVDDKGDFYFHTGEVPGSAGEILIISEKGELLKKVLPPLDVFSIESNFHFTNIHVDAKGNIYLPVTDPKGIKIVVLKF